MSTISPQDIRLCEHLLTQFYGHACGEIGSILLNRGRLPFSSLLRMSSLTGNSIRAALIVLIHQNCVYHSDTTAITSPDNSNGAPNATEYFEAIPAEILYRIRFGQFVNLADKQFGIESKLIVECLLDNGKLRVAQLVTMVCDQYHSQSKLISSKSGDENEAQHSALKVPRIVKSNIFNLLAERYLKPSHPKHSINPIDVELAFEKLFIAQLPGVPSPKDLKAVKEKVAERMVAEEEASFQEMCSFEQKQRALNSAQNDRNIHTKRQKTQEVVLEDDMFVRVNYERFNIKLRNSIFEQECFRSYNLEAGLVMRAMLMLAESKQKHCRDLASDPISAQAIVMKIGSKSNMVKTCFPNRAANGQFNLKLKNTGDLVAEMLSIMAKQDDLGTTTNSAYLIGSLDKALAQLNPLPIVSEKKNNVLGGGSGSGGMREFKIEYARYSIELRKSLVCRIIREKFGVEAARVVRVLMHKGRLDEKHLAKFAMMTLKDSRELCLKLLIGKIIELQEVPKTNDRQPSRTFYLYFVDFHKLILNLTMMIRKSQTNVIIRIDQELRKFKALIGKINRSDVYADQLNLLTVWEQADLKKIRKVLEALEVAKLRLERDVFILNDLPWLS